MITFDEAAVILDDLIEELPDGIYDGLNGGVNLIEESKKNDYGDYLMGLYHVNEMGRYIEIFYGSFVELYGDMDQDSFTGELRKVLHHELTHHVENLAGDRTLEKWDEEQAEKRQWGYVDADRIMFIDDDGSAYLIFESRPTMGFYIVKLSDDYLSVEKEIAFIQSPLEGGALVHYRGLYYIVASALTGWNPNPNKVASAPSLSGPWSEFTDIAPPETKTYNSQSTYLLKVTGTKDTTIIFMADRWNPRAQWNSRYLWMPVEIGNGKLWIPEPRPWTINVKTGVHSFKISGDKNK